MRITFLLRIAICLTFTFKVSSGTAQITLEHTYDTAALELMMVDLEVSGKKYVHIHKDYNVGERKILLYNLDHSLWKTIDCSGLTVYDPNYYFSVLYLTEKLFDLDDGLEFMYFTAGNPPANFVGIYNEDLSTLFEEVGASTNVTAFGNGLIKLIYNTPNGTKMILSYPEADQSKVYSLTGTLTTSGLIENPDILSGGMEAFPNPSGDLVVMHYDLPETIPTGKIVVTDLAGNLIRTYDVDHSFSTLNINQQELADGMYIYSLYANGQLLQQQKIVVNH